MYTKNLTPKDPETYNHCPVVIPFTLKADNGILTLRFELSGRTFEIEIGSENEMIIIPREMILALFEESELIMTENELMKGIS